MYDGKHRHIVDAIVAIHESAGILDPKDLSKFSDEELLAIVAYIGAECIALEDRHALLEAAQGPIIEELNKHRGIKLLTISRLLRRPEEGPDATVAFRSLKKWQALVEDARAFAKGQEISNRRNLRLLTTVRAAAEESESLARNPRAEPEARNQALTHSQLVNAWWTRMFKSASGHALAVPGFLASLVGIKAAAGSSSSAVGSGILGLTTAQVAAGATALAVASSVVVASQPEKLTPRAVPTASSTVLAKRLKNRPGDGPSIYGTTSPRHPSNVVPYLDIPTAPLSLGKSLPPSSSPTPSVTSEPTIGEHPETPPLIEVIGVKPGSRTPTPPRTPVPEPTQAAETKSGSVSPKPSKPPTTAAKAAPSLSPTASGAPSTTDTPIPSPTVTASPTPTGTPTVTVTPALTPAVTVTPTGTPTASPTSPEPPTAAPTTSPTRAPDIAPQDTSEVLAPTGGPTVAGLVDSLLQIAQVIL